MVCRQFVGQAWIDTKKMLWPAQKDDQGVKYGAGGAHNQVHINLCGKEFIKVAQHLMWLVLG